MNYKKWKQISDEGYSSDAISLLQFIKNGEEMDEDHLKTQSILSLLNRKELINDGKLTLLGEELLNNLELEEIAPTKAKRSDKFEDWWSVYPSTDAFELNGRKFNGMQSKKKDKAKCKGHFDKAVREGIDPDDIIAATKYHIDQAKKMSLKKGESQLTFISGSEIYLRNRVYMPFIDLAKTEVAEPEFKSNIL